MAFGPSSGQFKDFVTFKQKPRGRQSGSGNDLPWKIDQLSHWATHDEEIGQRISPRGFEVVPKSILKMDEDNTSDFPQKTGFEDRRRYADCNRKADEKTKYGCSSCSKPVCKKHFFGLCRDCVGN